MDNLSSINEPESAIPDVDQARQETEYFDEKNRGRENKHRHRLTVWSLYILWFIAAALVLIRLYHFLGSQKYLWLSRDQVDAIDTTLLSGAVGGFITRYGKNLVKMSAD